MTAGATRPRRAVRRRPEVLAAAWLATLARRRPLVLAPDGARGWFRGRAIVAFDPVDGGVFAGNGPEALHAAGAVLERALNAREPLLAVAALPYSGDVRWALYERGARAHIARLALVGQRAGAVAGPSRRTLGAERARPRQRPDRRAPRVGPRSRRVSTSRGFVSRGWRRPARRSGAATSTCSTSRASSRRAPSCRRPSSSRRSSPAPRRRWRRRGFRPTAAPAIVSASPERFVRLTGHEVEIAPVKGTRPRGDDAGRGRGARGRSARLGEGARRARDGGRPGAQRHRARVRARQRARGPALRDRDHELLPPSGQQRARAHARRRGRRRSARGDVSVRLGHRGAEDRRDAHRRGARVAARAAPYTGSLVVAMPGELDSSVLIRTAQFRRGPAEHDGPHGPRPCGSAPRATARDAASPSSRTLGRSGRRAC